MGAWERCFDGVKLQKVGRGQEFVLDVGDYLEAMAWATNLLSDPAGRIEALADHLGLRGAERTEHIDRAMWTAVPKRLRPWFETKLSGAKPAARRRG